MGAELPEVAGARLKDYVTAKAADKWIVTISELGRRAHVSRDTFQKWWQGRMPARATAELVARELGVTYGDLIAAREGIERSPAGVVTEPAGLSSLVEAIERLTEALSSRVPQPDDLDRRILQAVEARFGTQPPLPREAPESTAGSPESPLETEPSGHGRQPDSDA